MFADNIKIAYMKQMFGDSLLANLHFLINKYMIEEIFDTGMSIKRERERASERRVYMLILSLAAFIFPRRSGKTVAAAIMIAIIAVSQPNGNSIMYV
jgi:hypothetical protein